MDTIDKTDEENAKEGAEASCSSPLGMGANNTQIPHSKMYRPPLWTNRSDLRTVYEPQHA
jgi:hypothetical protein